jgi:molybdate transport system ATP-binding protein
MTLSVTIRHALPSFDLDVAFESAGRLTALFGPSGCGKTTTINVIAGLLRPTLAKVTVNGTVFADTARGDWLQAHQRRVGYVFQDARLLPHLTVRQNLRYGQWFTPPALRYADEAAIVAMLDLSALLQRRPEQLSGGEKQRIAIGRALLQSPRLLLMDEPLASLDEARKQEILPYIERLRDEGQIPIIYVSHAVDEVARLATDVVLMAKGRVVEAGTVQNIMPTLAAAGDELGHDAGTLLKMRVARHDTENDLTILASNGDELRIAGHLDSTSEDIRIHIRAADVMLATAKPIGLSALNIFDGVVETMTNTGGPSVDVMIRSGSMNIAARITRFSAKRLAITPGKRVYAIIKAMSVRHPSASQNRKTEAVG